jgi:hypothetical protein
MSVCNHGPSIMSRSFLNSSTLIVNIKRNPREISQFWQKIRQSIPQLILFNRGTAGGTVNLHVFQVRLKQRKVSSHPHSSISPSTISSSPIPPSPNPLSRLLGQFDYLNIKNISHNGRQKSGIKSTGGFTFCTATAILHCAFYPALLLSAGDCEKQPDCIT